MKLFLHLINIYSMFLVCSSLFDVIQNKTRTDRERHKDMLKMLDMPKLYRTCKTCWTCQTCQINDACVKCLTLTRCFACAIIIRHQGVTRIYYYYIPPQIFSSFLDLFSTLDSAYKVYSLPMTIWWILFVYHF